MLLRSLYSYNEKDSAICLRFWNHTTFCVGSRFNFAVELLLSVVFFPLLLIFSGEELWLSSVEFPIGFNET